MRTKFYESQGPEASRLRQRKHQLARRFGIPHELLGGSINQVERKCGKPSCHCASGSGHPMWTLTYSVGGKRHVEFIPEELVDEVASLVERGRAHQRALAEIRAINAQLLTFWRKQRRTRAKPRKRKK